MPFNWTICDSLTQHAELQLSDAGICRLWRVVDHAAVNTSIWYQGVIQGDVCTPRYTCSRLTWIVLNWTCLKSLKHFKWTCENPNKYFEYYPCENTNITIQIREGFSGLTCKTHPANEWGVFDHLTMVVHNHLQVRSDTFSVNPYVLYFIKLKLNIFCFLNIIKNCNMWSGVSVLIHCLSLLSERQVSLKAKHWRHVFDTKYLGFFCPKGTLFCFLT